MPESTHHTPDPVHAAARQAGRIVELLDILWEQARNDIPPPTSPSPSSA